MTMIEIPLTQGKVALIDDDDVAIVSAFRWYAKRDGYTFYAVRKIPCAAGKQYMQYMHRLVLSLKLTRELVDGELADHENGDGLDNRRCNLRLATYSQNGHNRRRQSNNNTSRFLGVCWDAHNNKWKAQIQINGTVIVLGVHATELEACEARESFIGVHPELMARRNLNQDDLNLGG
jgi:hypothetical protein